MVVHIFKPSHDEALAINTSQYCPSKAARHLGAEQWDLAKWWMKEGDFILRLPENGSLKGVETPDWEQVTAIEPWGWDRHIKGVLLKLGAPERLLPGEAELEEIRNLSSRKTAVNVVKILNERLQNSSSESGKIIRDCGDILRAENRWCESEEEIVAAIHDFGGRAMLKAPWSCSGRGVWQAEATSSDAAEVTDNEKFLLRARKCLRSQGAVEVEPLYERQADFAMEFFCDETGTLKFEGLSFFSTGEEGAYQGNLVAPQSEIEARILSFGNVSHSTLEALTTLLEEILSQEIGTHYHGPLGVDMMLTPSGIHPCIEVNLRNTMGRVALFQQKQKKQ